MSLGCRKGSLTFCISAVSGAFLVSRCSSFAEIRLLGGNINKSAMSLLGLSCYTTNRANLPVTLAVILPNRSMIFFCVLLNISAHFAVTIVYTNCSIRIYPILAICCVLIAVSFEIINSGAALNGAVLPMLIGAILVVFAPLVGIGSLVDLAGLGSLADRAGACFFTVSLAGRSSGNLPCAPLVTLCRDLFAALVVGAGVINAVDGDNEGALITGLVALIGAGSILTVNWGCFMHCTTRKLSAASCASDGVGALKSGGIEVGRKNVMGFDLYIADCAPGRSHAESSGVELMTGGSKYLNVDDVVADLALFPLFALFGAVGFVLLGLVVVAFSLYLSSADGALGIADGALDGDFLAFFVGDLVSIRSILVSFPCVDGLVAAFTQALAGVAGRSSRINEVTESSNAFGSVDNLGSLGIAEHGLAGLAGPVFLQTGSNAGSRLLGSVYEVMSKLRNDNVIADGAGNSLCAGCLCILVIDMGSSGTSLYGAADLAGAPVGGFVFIRHVIMFSRAVCAGGSKNSAADRAVVMVDTGFAAGGSLYKQILDLQAMGELGLTLVNGKSVRPCCGSGKFYGISCKIV